LLDHKADVNAQDNIGTTILHMAAYMGHERVVSSLLQHDADIETRNANGGTALAAAVEGGFEAVVKLLLARKATVNYSYHLYQHRSIAISSIRVKGRLVFPVPLSDGWQEGDWFDASKDSYYLQEDSFGTEDFEWVIERQVSPLWRAAEKNDDAVMRLLMDEGAELDFVAPTPSAKMFGGQQPQPQSPATVSPLLWAARTGHALLVKMLIERGHDNTTIRNALSMAAKEGYADLISVFLASNKVDVERKDKWGRTALSYAAQNNRPNAVRVLIESGKVDPDSKCNYGRTPLSYVAGETYVPTEQVVELLITSAKVNPDSKDKNGRTPLSYAAERGHIPAAKLLVSSDKVDLNSKDNKGRTPLSHACDYFTEFFLGFDGVEIESKDNGGGTALSHAAGDGEKDVVRVLLEHGADRDSKDDRGQTPLMWARKCSKAFQKGPFRPTRGRITRRTPQYSNVLELLNT
jgi:ankyrin repeat protein